MAIIEWEKKESLAIINMCNNANKQNLTFVSDMNSCLDQIVDDTEIYAIVVTSTDEKNFSQGIDVDWLGQRLNESDFDTIKSFLYGINDIFKRFSSPVAGY